MTERDQDELGEVLRPAVEQVRRDPPPEAARARALGRARRIGQPAGGPANGWPARLVLLAGAAASLLLGMSLRPGHQHAGTVPEDAGPRAGRTRVLAGPSRVLGVPVPDDILRIAIGSDPGRPGGNEGGPFAALRDADGRELHRVAVVASAVIADGVALTTAEHVFRNPLPFDAVARFEDSLPDGASLLSRTARVGGDEFDAADSFPLPAGTPVRVVVAYEEPLVTRGGRLAYTFPLPRGLLDEFSFTLTAEEGLARGATFLPANARRAETKGASTWTVVRRRVRPSGSIIFLAAPRD